MTPEQITQMKAALDGATPKPWSAFTDDSRDTPHTNIVGVIPNTSCIFSLLGKHKNDPNVALIALAPDMAAHIIALESRVEAADLLAYSVMAWGHNETDTGSVISAVDAYRATGADT